MDGFVDVVVKGINSHIPNVDDQVIFSSGSASNGQARIATSLGSLMAKTMTNISGSLSTANYFTQFKTRVREEVEYRVCIFYYDYYWIHREYSAGLVLTPVGVRDMMVIL